MNYIPDLRIETMDISGEFQNLVVNSGILVVQKGILENASLLESELVVAYSIYHTQSST